MTHVSIDVAQDYQNSTSLHQTNKSLKKLFNSFISDLYDMVGIFFFFFANFSLQNMLETTLPDGLETSGRRAYR